MNASTLRGFAVLALLCRLPRVSRVFVLGIFLTAPAHALVMVSESRSVFANYHGGGDRSELITSNGNFGTFAATADGIPFGGGFVNATQNSTITTSGFDLWMSIQDYYGPGGTAETRFEFTFALPQPTRISITGFSWYFSGMASLDGVAMNWTGPSGVKDWWNNYLFFDQILEAGQHTFSSYENMRGDGISTRITMREVTVPEGGPTAWMLAIGMLSVMAIRRSWRRPIE